MSNDSRHQLCYVAGSPWLNLVATVADRLGPDPAERLSDTARLAEWLHHELGSDPALDVTEADLARAHRVRAVLRSLAVSTLEGVPPDPEAVAAANRALSAYRAATVYVEDGRLRHTPPQSVDQAMTWVIRQAMVSLVGEEASRLRMCAEPVCGGIFLDPTGRRRWCPSGRCGVKARVRAHRMKLKDAV
ncbi:CGNR zinc finger domain-containing protein [Phytomonospora endophytica]|uniref:Putative RNA-binding Zn ribbon-like protein n=1 Tax=Phytomonospora endophytica TaxID=714109 RepID=A0A841FU59_9ACTN|nr:CGNR zinc finger domain-containing protein [Phytomonospora endophytica]MBB6039885.1 putative RNA-binding Zn ribbon-like protein [Phytomonospora endophytica]GIG71045.1 hypothetical protein Pen01_73400 [Phytomonospora endophytica]